MKTCEELITKIQVNVECGSELDTGSRNERMERVKNDSWAFGLGTRRMELLLAEIEKSVGGIQFYFGGGTREKKDISSVLEMLSLDM